MYDSGVLAERTLFNHSTKSKKFNKKYMKGLCTLYSAAKHIRLNRTVFFFLHVKWESILGYVKM